MPMFQYSKTPVPGHGIRDDDRVLLVGSGSLEPRDDFVFAFEHFVIGPQAPFDVVRDLRLGGDISRNDCKEERAENGVAFDPF
jgi:hypothetical protein